MFLGASGRSVVRRIAAASTVFLLLLSLAADNSLNGKHAKSRVFVSAFWDGIVSIDTSNFDKLVTTGERTVLVKFDRKNPHGPLMDEWRALASTVGDDMGPTRSDIILAEVNCHHEIWWNDATRFNMDLCDRYNVTFDADYRLFKPAFRLFKRGELDKSILFIEEDITALSLKRFLQQHTDVDFGLPGVISSLSVVATDALRVFQRRMTGQLPSDEAYAEEHAALQRRLKQSIRNTKSEQSEDADYYAAIISRLLPDLATLKTAVALGETSKKKKAAVPSTIGTVDVGFNYLHATWAKLRKVEKSEAKTRQESEPSEKKKKADGKDSSALSDAKFAALQRKVNILSSMRDPDFVVVTDRIHVPPEWDVKKRAHAAAAAAAAEAAAARKAKPKPWHRPTPTMPEGAEPPAQPAAAVPDQQPASNEAVPAAGGDAVAQQKTDEAPFQPAPIPEQLRDGAVDDEL